MAVGHLRASARGALQVGGEFAPIEIRDQFGKLRIPLFSPDFQMHMVRLTFGGHGGGVPLWLVVYTRVFVVPRSSRRRRIVHPRASPNEHLYGQKPPGMTRPLGRLTNDRSVYHFRLYHSFFSFLLILFTGFGHNKVRPKVQPFLTAAKVK